MTRNFLNTLIEIGVDVNDMPSFCYSVNLDQIRRFILEKKGKKMLDRRMPIKDLLQTLGISSIRHFTTKFKKEWSNFASVQEGNTMLVTGDDVLFHFDFVRGIVTINPSRDRIDSFDVFKLYCNLLSERYNVKSTVKEATSNWWILSIEANDPDSTTFRALQKSNLAEVFDAIYLDEIEGSTYIQTEVVLDSVKEYLEAENLNELFVKVCKICSKD